MELENDKTLNFLDLSIKGYDDELVFHIYRKPTYTDTTVPYDSMSPIRPKICCLNILLLRD